ncbi:MAG: Na+/H+ antiporter subunit E [Ardenticatenaceae bacterium]|nr:Na+/H+ antiporter subunit E [Ardenticatenaceae bacterium]
MSLLILLIVIWIAISGEISLENIGVGLVLGLILLWAGGRAMQVQYFTPPTQRWPIRFWRIFKFSIYFLKELIAAGLSVFVSILDPSRLRPGVVAVPLDLTSGAEITLLANLITLTPGTLTLEVAQDRKTIFVHTIYLDDPDSFRANIKDGFERRIQELSQL